MKLRKHKNNKTFRISFATRTPARIVTHVNPNNGATRKEVVLESISNRGIKFAVGSDAPSVLRAFLFGRDATNIHTSIRESVRPVWTGRLVNS